MADKILGTRKTQALRDSHNIDNDYICFYDDNIDFSWPREQIPKVIAMWKSGLSIEQISERTERPIDEVAMLLIDQARNNNIKAREGGIFGSRED